METEFNPHSLKTSIADISKPDEKGLKFKDQESADDRVKRQKNEFFTLLTAQLKHQDPMSPMETNEITSQIFAINNVEQQLMTNKHLEDIKSYFSANQSSNYLNYIGKLVDYVGDKVMVEGLKGSFDYEILEPAVDAKIEIKNAEGMVIHTEAAEKGMGKHCFTWNKPSQWPDGIYTFSVTALKEDDSRANVKLYAAGRVNGIVSKDGAQFFDVNGKVLPVDHITRVRDGSVVTNSILSSIQDKIDQISGKIGSAAASPITAQVPNFDDPNIMEEIKRQLAAKVMG